MEREKDDDDYKKKRDVSTRSSELRTHTVASSRGAAVSRGPGLYGGTHNTGIPVRQGDTTVFTFIIIASS